MGPQTQPIIVMTLKENTATYRTILTNCRVTISSFEEGIPLLKQNDSDLLVLDCGFENSTGIRLLRNMKRIKPELPVIFLTDRSTESVAVQAFKAGAREYFKKPVDPDELRQAVDAILSVKRGTGERRLPLSLPVTTAFHPAAELHPNLPANLRRVLRSIEINLSDQITLDSLARNACLSKFHFCRLFKRYFHRSPLQYVMHLRLEHALVLLEQSDLSISAVAERVGCRDLSQFIRKFKKFTGTTPLKYRHAATASVRASRHVRQ